MSQSGSKTRKTYVTPHLSTALGGADVSGFCLGDGRDEVLGLSLGDTPITTYDQVYQMVYYREYPDENSPNYIDLGQTAILVDKGRAFTQTDYDISALYESENRSLIPSDTVYEPGVGNVIVNYAKTDNVTLDLQGGILDETVLKVKHGGPITLPEPKKPRYVFTGWYTAAEGGIQVTDGLIIYSDMTIYAHWREAVCTLTLGGESRITYVNDVSVSSNTNVSCKPGDVLKIYGQYGMTRPWYIQDENGDQHLHGYGVSYYLIVPDYADGVGSLDIIGTGEVRYTIKNCNGWCTLLDSSHFTGTKPA